MRKKKRTIFGREKVSIIKVIGKKECRYRLKVKGEGKKTSIIERIYPQQFNLNEGMTILLTKKESSLLNYPLQIKPRIIDSSKEIHFDIITDSNILGEKWVIYLANKKIGEGKVGGKTNSLKIRSLKRKSLMALRITCQGRMTKFYISDINRPRAYTFDYDYDGHQEVILENAYIRVVIRPRRGGSITAIYDRKNGIQYLPNYEFFQKKMRAIQTCITERLGNEFLYFTKFKVAEISGNTVTLEGKQGDLKISKRITLRREPIVEFKYHILAKKKRDLDFSQEFLMPSDRVKMAKLPDRRLEKVYPDPISFWPWPQVFSRAIDYEIIMDNCRIFYFGPRENFQCLKISDFQNTFNTISQFALQKLKPKKRYHFQTSLFIADKELIKRDLFGGLNRTANITYFSRKKSKPKVKRDE